MAVEQMEMLNIIGHLEDLDFIARELVLLECIHMVNAQHEINTSNFTISTTEKNMDALVDVCFIKPYRKSGEITAAAEQILRLMDAFGYELVVDRGHILKHFSFEDTIKLVTSIHNEVKERLAQIDLKEEALCRNQELKQYFKYLKDIHVSWEDLKAMEFFYFKIGMFTKENMQKLRKNYENVPSVLFKVQSLPQSDVVISIAPNTLMVELDRIFSSLSFQEIDIPEELSGTPIEIIKKLEASSTILFNEIQALKKEIKALKDQHGYNVQVAYSQWKTYEKMLEINQETALSNDFFYMAGWIPLREKTHLEAQLTPVIDRTLLYYKSTEDVDKNIIPPTRLHNFRAIKPFETMVTMYGIPSYGETDPTLFVGITYMLMFGLMFGDLGQGSILLLAGLLLSRRMARPNLGGILSRLGISSMIFGLLYGSFFGFEDVIPALLIRPMDNIQLMLIGAVIFGILILTVAFIYSLVNAYKHKDLEEGVLGRNGVAGLLFYWTILLSILYYVLNGHLPLPIPIILLILSILMGLMVVKHPLANYLLKKRPLYQESPTDYYIEGGFGIAETLLSMLSNTISFVRVGAFALNHVGLFIAFLTMARMMGRGAGSVLILIIGNLVVIGLEGLIVFIQGLRLEYYEVFSKFYQGKGIPYRPVAVSYRPIRKKSNAPSPRQRAGIRPNLTHA